MAPVGVSSKMNARQANPVTASAEKNEATSLAAGMDPGRTRSP